MTQSSGVWRLFKAMIDRLQVLLYNICGFFCYFDRFCGSFSLKAILGQHTGYFCYEREIEMTFAHFLSEESAFSFTLLLTLVVLVLTLFLVWFGKILSHRLKVGFTIVISFVVLAAVSEWFGVYMNYVHSSSFRVLHILIKLLELSLIPTLPILLSIAIGRFYRFRWFALALSLSFNFSLHIALLPAKLVFYVDDSNVTHYGPLYWIYPALVFCGIVVLYGELLHLLKRYQKKRSGVAFFILFLSLLAFVPEFFIPELRFSFLLVSIAILLLYGYFCNTVLRIEPLSSLLDRRSFDDDIRKLRRGDVLLLFDINQFKQLNDRYGHKKGDRYLIAISAMIRSVYDDYGLCYRIGGDEFAVILNSRKADVEKLNAAFLSRLNNERKRDPVLPDLSLGYCRSTGKESCSEIFNAADVNLYASKNSFRNSDDTDCDP